MVVSELIEKLQQLPQHLTVGYEVYECGQFTVIEAIAVYQDNGMVYLTDEVQ